MIKKILLDVDGVMITTPSWKKLTILEDGFSAFDKNCVRNLNRILRETNAEIVLTTSHKDTYTEQQWQDIFVKRGVNVTKITKARTHVTRRMEVKGYFSQNPADESVSVIIDDDKSLNDLPYPLKDRLVLTESLIGISDEKASLAVEILNG